MDTLKIKIEELNFELQPDNNTIHISYGTLPLDITQLNGEDFQSFCTSYYDEGACKK